MPMQAPPTAPLPSTAPRAVNRSPRWPAGEPFELALPPGTMVDALRRAAAVHPDATAIAFYGRETRYRALDEEVERLARMLRDTLHVCRGDRVLLCLQNAPQFVAAFHAVLRADAVVVSANPMYKTAELQHLVHETEARVAVVGEDVLPQLAPLCAPAHGQAGLRAIVARYADALPTHPRYRLPALLCDAPAVLQGPAQLPWPTGPLQGAPVVSAAGPDDLALLIYTSGTTGRPKACMHTHRAMLFTAQAQLRWYGVDRQSVVSGFQPLFHVAGMQHSMNTPIVAGAAMVITTRWDGEVALRLVADHGITYVNAPPTMVVDLLSQPGLGKDALRTLRVITGGGSAMPEIITARLKELTGLDYIEAYGMTEAMSPTHINPLSHPKRKCGGIPIHETTALVIDPATLQPLAPGEMGEIVLSGPQIFKGYWRRPDADAEAFVTVDGRRYYRSGDLGHVDDENYVFMSDRLKRMINASGFKVWPAEVESMLYEHPAILECAVISTPDAYRGEDVKALVVLKPGHAGTVTEPEIVAWARSIMAVYKAPRCVEFRAVLPRTASNKIDWRGLQDREWAAAKAAAGT
jgi:fatty-acyl-CoA synthase